MKVALVASSYVPRLGVLQRHVHELAMGLRLRGVDVEVLTQDARRHPAVAEFDGFVVRRFVATFRKSEFALAPGLWEYLRRSGGAFDLVHAHSAHASLALAVARARPGRLVFTPHAPIQRLLRRPYRPVLRTLIRQGAQVLCTATAESEALRRAFPWAGSDVAVVPQGVDVAAIKAARPFAYPDTVVLTVGRIERYKRMDRAVAAVAALDPGFRLMVVGDGPAREKLVAHAGDLGVLSRVSFVGPVPEADLYRWLRTASVVVALAEHESSGLHVTEALCAGASVVASDIPVHREAASYAGGVGVFVSPAGSPLDVADGIREAAELSFPERLPLQLPSWDETVERTLAFYTAAIRRAAAGRG